MRDDDQEPSSDPFGPLDPIDGERSMTLFGAIAWTFLATSTYLLLLLLLVSLSPGKASDLVMNFGAQVFGTLLTLFCILRLYAPNTSIRHFLGLRGTHPGFYVLAGLLGVIIQIPTSALYDLILKRHPLEADHDVLFMENFSRGRPWQAIIFFILVLAGPFLEEVFFRGALFRPLRKENTAVGVVLVSSVLFAFVHLEKQIFLPIAILGFVLGTLRSASGSLLPSVVMHATFNGASFWSMFERFKSGATNSPEGPPPLSLIGGASMATIFLVVMALILGRYSRMAKEAQNEDLA